ncbi:Uncharacterised protein [Vibrio cholerae]|nr:Uncharacterised protein [Vibrio cholerae]CSC61257.1 Uncharacterised protein [Vibrio cholerae]
MSHVLQVTVGRTFIKHIRRPCSLKDMRKWQETE